jgi:hypothetical protein
MILTSYHEVVAARDLAQTAISKARISCFATIKRMGKKLLYRLFPLYLAANSPKVRSNMFAVPAIRLLTATAPAV